MSSSWSLTPGQVAGLDDPALLTQCQLGPRGAQGEVAIGLGLSGLYCASCALTIEAALKPLSGVKDVQVQGATQRARLLIDPTQVKLSQLVQAVMRAGYQAWPDGAVQAAQERQQAQRQLLWRLLVAAFCMMQVMMVTTSQYVAGRDEIAPDLWQLLNWTAWVLSLPVMVFSCGPFFQGAWLALKQGRIAMDTPVALGIAAMFGVSTGVMFGYTEWLGHDLYFDSLTMFVTFLLLGRWLERRARERVTQSLESLCARLPEAVERTVGSAWPPQTTEVVPVSGLSVGDHVQVLAGQAFPADGVVVDGHTEVDESLLTGESRPVARGVGESVIAGSMNLGGAVWCRVEQLGADTRYQQVVSLVQQALTDKPGWLRVADRFAGPFLWAVLALALLGALAWQWIDPSRSVWVAVSVLVVTCPCALSLAAPSALLAAAGALAKAGVLVRQLDAIEALSHVRQMLFDKTGTLTDSAPQVTQVWSDGRVWQAHDPDLPAELAQALVRAATLAAHSTHPLSRGLTAWLASFKDSGHPVDQPLWQHIQEVAGSGLQAQDAQGRTWRLGSAAWALGASPHAGVSPVWPEGRIWLARQQDEHGLAPTGVLGMRLDEQARSDAAATLNRLRQQGIDVALLSGDQTDRVHTFAQGLGMAPALRVAAAQASPQDKLRCLAQARSAGADTSASDTLAVVGDGINDAPVLAGAQVSFAMDQGAALAQSHADFIVLGGRLQGIPQAVDISRRAMRVVRQNLLWAAVYNFVCIPLALMGWLSPWLAGLGMALSSLAVLLNALRVSRG